MANATPERDLVGYGPHPPNAPWPAGARIAVSFVINYEEGSEQSVLDGDGRGESLSELAMTPDPGERDLAMESMYTYGSRAGIWRLLRTFDLSNTPVSIYACALAVERNPVFARYLAGSSHELVSHGYRWEEVFKLSEEEEREHMRLAVESLTRTIGRRPLGWYCRYGPSTRTRRLLLEEGGFEYDCDSYDDDLPMMVEVEGQPWCVVPHALDTNDLKFWRASGIGTAEDFFQYLKDTFNVLYREGDSEPRMMTVSLHCRVAGRPGRAAGVERFLHYAMDHERVWFARRIDIARAWKSVYGAVPTVSK